MRILRIAVISIISVALFFSCDFLNPGLGDRVDISAPLVFVSSHTNGAYTHGAITLAGNFEEDMLASRIQVSFDNGATYVDAVIDQTAKTWSYDWDTSSVPDGEYNLIFLITDGSGKMTNRNLLVYVDNTGPMVLMSTPSIYGGSAIYYGSAFSVRGETADQFGVASVSLEIWDNAETTLLATITPSGTSTWSTTFNSAAFVPATGTLKFRIIATDKAGNVSTKFYHYYDILVANTYTNIVVDDVYKIATNLMTNVPVKTFLDANGTAMIPLYFDQDSNKPTIEIYNPDNSGAANNILTSTSRLSGKAIDSDGIAAGSVEIQIRRQSDSAIIIPWASTGNPLSPSVSWSYVMPGAPPMVDNIYTLEVRASDIGMPPNQRTSAPVAFTIDSGAPSLTVDQPTQGQYLNGNFTISGTANDAQGIKRVEVSLNDGVSYTNAVLDTATTWHYDVTSPVNGSMLIKVRAVENTVEEKKTTFNLQVIVDRTNPTVSFTYPAQSATVNGQVIFKGTSSDNTQITKIELKIGKFDPFIVLAGTYNWEYTIDSTSYANATHSTETAPLSNVWKLDVQARATDVASNMTTLSTYYIYIDNDTDKPQVNIISPSNGQNIAGPVLISGTAVDDDAVDYVQIQMDINGDGDFADLIDIGNGLSKTLDSDTNDRFENETLWYTVTGATAWTEMINKFGELYDRNDTTPALDGNITIRVRAVDINTPAVTGNYQQIAVHLDDTIPRIEELNLMSNDYVRGMFPLHGHARDNVLVSDILISYDGGINYSSIFADAGKVTQTIPGNTTDYTIDFNINSSTYVPVSGNFFLRLKVVDNANYQNISYLNLQVDNVYPTGSYTIAADDIFGSGSNSRLQGVAHDTGTVAGIEKVEVYFTRGTGPYTLYSPTGAGPTGAISNDFGDGSGSVPYVSVGNKANYVISIDKATELGDDNSGNGDNDGYNESLTLAGSDYNWWAQFGPDYNSTNITDGAITIHYVVFDKAGNGTHYSRAGFIKNNKPSFTSIVVGTDLDDSDTVTAGERQTYNAPLPATINIYARNYLYIGMAASDNNAVSDFRVYHPNASGTLVQSVAAGQIDINGYGEGATTFLCRVTDSDGITTDYSIDVVIDNVDTIDPVVTLNDLATADSFSGAVYVGHIELAGVSPYGLAATPDVSGTVVLRGHMHDNQRIQYFNLGIDYYDLGSGATNPGTEVALLSWPNTNAAGTYGNLTISNVTLTESTGHDFDWTYVWNTAGLSTRTGGDITVTVRAIDFNSRNNAATRDHDVVPYIREIGTSLSSLYAAHPSVTNRTALGHYPVRRSETLDIYGYNFNGASTTFTINGVSAGATTNVVTTTQVRITVPVGATSGQLVGTVGTTTTINHLNNNGYAYNMEPNGINNDTLDDNRYLDVWAFTSVLSNASVTYPTMRINPVDATNSVSFSYAIAEEFYMMKDSTASAYWETTYNNYTWTNLGFDSLGNFYGVATNQSHGGDTWATGARATFFMRSSPASRDNLTTSQRKRQFDSNWNGTIYNSFRTQSPDLYITGAGSDADPALCYLVYLSDTDHQIRFRYGSQGAGADAITGSITNGPGTAGGSADGYHVVGSTYNGAPSVAAVGTTAVIAWYSSGTQSLHFTYNTNPSGATAAQWTTNDRVLDTFAGQVSDIAVDAGGGIHIAYYSASSGDLKYAYLSAYNVMTDVPTTNDPTIVTVDSFLATGTNLMIQVRSESGNYVPYISYFFGSFVDTKGCLRMAYRIFPNALGNGATLDKYTGNWEVTAVPTDNIPKNYTVSMGFLNSSGRTAVGYVTTAGLEYGQRY